MHLPTIKQLRYFVALDRHGHFGKAAASCFVSQSAFSTAIRELEALLGVQLVDRTNKQVTITATGREIANQARVCLNDLEHLVTTAQSHHNPLSGKLRLGVIPTIAPFLLPRILPAMRTTFPKLKLYLHEDQSQRIYAMLVAGELDLILMALPYPLRGVEIMDLFADPFHLAYCTHSKLVQKDRYEVEALPRESILLLEDGHCLRDHALAACHLSSPEQISPFAASSLLTLVEMVDADLGITYLPEMALNSALLNDTHIRTVPLAEDHARRISLIWRQGSAFDEPFRSLGRFIKEQQAAG